MNSEYRDAVFQAREDVSEGRREFYKLFGASGFSLLAAAACGGGSGVLGNAPAGKPGGESVYAENDYATILGPNAKGWKYLSIFDDDPTSTFAFMNYGTVGSIPKSVLQELVYWHRDIAFSPAGPNSWQTSNAIIRADSAYSMLGCLPQEMFCSFNTTDGMIKILSMIKWNKGDVILLTNNEHGGGLGPLYCNANRYGCTLVEVNVPTGVSMGPNTGGYDEATFLNRLEAAYQNVKRSGGKVRALMISSPCYTLGWRFEEEKISAWAYNKKGDSGCAGGSERGVITIFDCAHIPGAQPVDCHNIGCDYLIGTAGKWQCCPAQTGYAYIRIGKAGDATSTTFQGRSISTSAWTNPNPMEPLYINSATSYVNAAVGTGSSTGWGGIWTTANDLGGSLASVGNPNYPTLKTMLEVNKVWESVGRVNIAKYDQTLSQYLRQKLANHPKGGLYSMGVDFQTASGVVPTGQKTETTFPRRLQTGLTLFNPWSKTANGPDINKPLTQAESSAESSAASSFNSRLLSEFGIMGRTIGTKHQLRDRPEQSARTIDFNGGNLPASAIAAGGYTSTPCRYAVHLYTTVAEVDRLVDSLGFLL